MNVVGRFGSLISQGVYSVATPFHPFGGAIDVIVVQQQDGSFRSTPLYVKFGKFQGVLKGAEKIVKISVNGNEANFHMYLDNSGEAYFAREVDSVEETGTNGVLKDNGFICESDGADGFGSNRNGSNGEVYRLQHSVSKSSIEQLRENYGSLNRLERTDSNASRRYYDFQDDQSSPMSEYGSCRYENVDVENLVESPDLDSEVVLVSVDGHILTAPVSAVEQDPEDLRMSMPQFHVAPGDATEFCVGDAEFASTETSWTVNHMNKLGSSDTNAEPDKVNDMSIQDNTFDSRVHNEIENVSHGANIDDVFGSCLELSELTQGGENVKHNGSNPTFEVQNPREDELPPTAILEYDATEDGVVADMRDDFRLSLAHGSESSISDRPRGLHAKEIVKATEEFRMSVDSNTDSDSKEDQLITSAATASVIEDQESERVESEIVVSPEEAQQTCLSMGNQDSEMISVQSTGKEDERLGKCAMMEVDHSAVEHGDEKSLDSEAATSVEERQQPHPNLSFEISLCKDELHPGMGLSAAAEVFDAHRISLEEYKHSATSVLESENLVVRMGEMYLPWKKAAPIVLGKAAFDLDLPIQQDDLISVEENEMAKAKDDDTVITSSSGRRWRLWSIPFRRIKTIEHTSSNSSSEEFVDSEAGIQNSQPEALSDSDSQHEPPRKQFVRTNVPTSEQIASLNLRDGQNTITFSFSTRVLGTQQVDAHIYLWKWDAKIVISDVDGTITKSDVLGQFMPLVGRDWTQSGVAKLFSAIKENGYQLLFLSARAIVQAYLTRSFLLNLKQDGKALPNGPVVISPDGLFPALYREVIRRAPHEFKIACLEDIRNLFPSDYNPFYAGFGNRDTDELSYRKLGIPKGKIFIINPKGEVATGHRIDVKSYTSLHTLVNDMFPPTLLVEQEDYNSWNFWRIAVEEVE